MTQRFSYSVLIPHDHSHIITSDFLISKVGVGEGVGCDWKVKVLQSGGKINTNDFSIANWGWDMLYQM